MVVKDTWAVKFKKQMIAFYIAEVSGKHSKGLKTSSLCVAIGGFWFNLFLFNSLCYNIRKTFQ